MIDQNKLLNEIQTLLHIQHFGVLATQGIDYPYCSLIGYADTEDATQILFATIRDTHKYRNLNTSPNVSLLIDSQTNHVQDIKDAQALTVLGVAQEVEPKHYAAGLPLYLNKHPYLKEFVTAPDCALISIHVKKYIFVKNFQTVMEYPIA